MYFFLASIYMCASTGEAVTFTTRYLLTPAAGRRPMVPGVVVIIGDRKSSDNLTLVTSNLRATGAKTICQMKRVYEDRLLQCLVLLCQVSRSWQWVLVRQILRNCVRL